MKYWVYKDARILGPFDKDSVAGLPGVDASTLVSVGDSAAAGEGDWRPAGDVADLAALPLDRGPAWPTEEMSSTYGILDKLQLETAGLIGDDEFPAAAEELFQDPVLKAGFGGLLDPRPTVDEAELRRAKDRAAELTVQLEMLYKRVAELEAGQTDLVHRLAERELQLRSKFAPGSAPETVAAPAYVPPPLASSAPPAAPPPVVPPAAAPADWAAAPGGGAFPSFPSLGAPAPAAPPAAPPPSTPAPAAVLPTPPVPEKPAAIAALATPVPPPVDWAGAPVPAPSAPVETPSIPPIPAMAPLPPAPAPPAPLAAPEVPFAAAPTPPAPRKALFEKKTFKTVPTVKSFRVVGPAEPEAGAPASAESAALPAAPPPAAPPPAPEWPTLAPAPTPAPIALQPLPVAPPPPPPTTVSPAPAAEPFDAAAPAPMPAFDAPTEAVPSSILNPMSAPEPTPAPMPPATLSFGAPAKAEPAPEIPAFTNSLAVNDMSGAPSTEEALARLAKPAPAPPTKAPRPPRSNKPFLIGAGILVIVMTVIGVVFLRHPKDLKQMTELDDGRARLGAEPVTDDAIRPPLVKPKMAAPPADSSTPIAPSAPVAPAAPVPDAAETARAASQAKLDAAVAAVKDFPLDGDRGTVAQWLQFSYSASPDAGKETWSASETADKTYLVEYRFTPARGGDDVHYLFEVDMDRGFVIGKNLDAKSVLAGGPRVAAEKPKAKAKPKTRKPAHKKAARRPVEAATPKEVPLLPLPDEGALRPPAEDDGAFNSDTVNSGL